MKNKTFFWYFTTICFSLAVALGIVFSISSQPAFAAKTYLKNIHNSDNIGYSYHNAEWPNADGLIAPGADHDPQSAWVPWCDNSDHFNNGKYMQFTAVNLGKKYFLWQSLGSIYYSKVPGCNRSVSYAICPEGGNLRIGIKSNGLMCN